MGEKKVPTENNVTPGTVKSCMPFLDALSTGYLLLSSADLYISKKSTETIYQWSSNNLISFHDQDQIKGYLKIEDKLKKEKVPKFNNPWIVKTPKNYSCLFVTPFHHNLPFTILEGVVDTDTYFLPVNFPFVLNPDFEGLIPKGTPIAQIIPFKRENWSMNTGSLEESHKFEKKFRNATGTLSGEFFDKYKKHYWMKKEYK
jgi:hypothetical protein